MSLGDIGALAAKGLEDVSRQASHWFGAVNEEVATSGARQLEKLGPNGEALGNSLKAFTDRSEQSYGKFAAQYKNDMKSVIKDPQREKQYLGHYITGDPNVPDDIKQLVAKHRMQRLDLYSRAQKSGIKVAPLIADDYPHAWPKWVFEGEGRQNAIDHLVKTGQASDTYKAEKILDMRRETNLKDHNLESQRKMDLPGWRQDLAVIPDVMRSGERRVAYADVFGPKSENLGQMLDAIKAEHGNVGYQKAKKVVDVYLRDTGINYKPAGPKEQGVASLTTFTKLGLATLNHFGQPLNLMLYDGSVKPFIRGLQDTVRDYGNANEFAMRAGAVVGDTIREIKQRAGAEVGPVGQKLLKYSGFTSVDEIRRTFAANVGKHIADGLVEKLQKNPSDSFARQRLQTLGVDVAGALEKGLSESDYLMAAKRTSDITQFKFDALSVPPVWRESPLWRMLTMYKQFSFVQTKFLKDYVLKPAMDYGKSGGKDGSIKPLILAAMAFPTFGEIVADMKKYAREGSLDSRPDSDIMADRLVDNFAQAGGLGVFHDLIYSMSSPDQSPAWHFFGGPVMADLVDMASLPFNRRPLRTLGKETAQRVPIIGPQLAHRLYPSAKQKKDWLARGPITKSVHKLTDSF
jgi:hypothetical protein